MDLPSEYVAILEHTNGVEFNGFVLYGVDSVFFGDNAGSDNHRSLIENNEIWRDEDGLRWVEPCFLVMLISAGLR